MLQSQHCQGHFHHVFTTGKQKQGETLLGTPTFRTGVPGFQSQLCCNSRFLLMPGRSQAKTQVPETLPSTRGIWLEC